VNKINALEQITLNLTDCKNDEETLGIAWFLMNMWRIAKN